MFAEQKYWSVVVPFVIAIIVISIYRVNILLNAVAFLTPLSTTLKELGVYNPIGIDMALPTEPVLFGLMILALFKLFGESNQLKELFKHPISIAIGFYLTWLFITSISSSNPLVSFKVLITRLWFLSSFYILAFSWFKKRSGIHSFVKSYIYGLFIVAVYTIYSHASYGFEHEAAHWVMSPFFKDHTSYGMALALILPFSVYMCRYSGSTEKRAIFIVILTVLIIAVILSYTRAAWLSLVVSLIVFIIMKLRIKFVTLSLVSSLVVGFIWLFQTEIMMVLEKNSQDSSDSFIEHIESMTNVSTDASNLERINRWKSALRLFNERPHLGWGAGTYQFEYAPYQNYYEKTIISTNAGNMGNAHSEYLTALSETGWPGLLFFLILIVVIFTYSIVLYHKIKCSRDQAMLMACILGLVSYFSHAFLNNFFDMDKASVPIWAFVCVIVILDLKAKGRLLS